MDFYGKQISEYLQEMELTNLLTDKGYSCIFFLPLSDSGQ